MVDQICDKLVNLGKFVFDEKNYKQMEVVRTYCNKTSLVFSEPVFSYSFDASMCNCSNIPIHNMWRNDRLGSYLFRYSPLHFFFPKI